jgi:drug/metabolite transporter (DMT)-like permease
MTMAPLQAGSGPILHGVACTVGAWFLFALHDASIKVLVSDLSAWQILFARSVVILPLCLLLQGRERCLAGVADRSVRPLLLLNAFVYALAWVAYYTAARSLQLAELETIYYVSPVITTLLAVLLLKESVAAANWLALAVGFAGVLIACRPQGAEGDLMPVGLLLLGAALWAYSVVLTKRLSRLVSTSAQMFVNNGLFLLLCAVLAPWWWQLPSAHDLALMALVGVGAFAAQYLLYEGIRLAPASIVAPLEYTGLLWAFGLGFAIWGDIPAREVFWGAGLIIAGGLAMIVLELRPPKPGSALAAEA